MRPILSDAELADAVPHLDKCADLVDQFIDLTLNLRQSGHPGGSRSKVHLLLSLVLSGAMRFDARKPGRTFGDRFVLGAGHCTPLLYSMLALLNEALRAAHERTKDERFELDPDPHRVLLADDLLAFRRNRGLPGHAEMEGKSLFVKWNTGPSGHGIPSAAGEALALLHAGCRDVGVFAMDGEGGLSAGGAHEAKNAAHGLGLENFVILLDWNDFGIDHPSHSSFVAGDPVSWFEPYGWRVAGAERGEDFAAVIRAYRAILNDPDKQGRPGVVWSRNRKGRGYGVEGYKSHGTAHKPNSEIFWEVRKSFQDKYGVKFDGFGEPPPKDGPSFKAQTKANLDVVRDVLRRDTALVDFIAKRLMIAADAIPAGDDSLRGNRKVDPTRDARITDVAKYPAELFLKPGAAAPNRQGFGAWGAYVNSIANDVAKRPLFIVCAADLAESTNIAGFSKAHGDFKGFGWYERNTSREGCLVPQQITEFANSAMMVGLASVNFAADPEKEFVGYFGSCATYGSFSYLKYGPMRLFSQLAQDSQLKVGRVIWVAGHSGPETAEDSRTHFGIFAPGVTDLFPRGHTLDLHPFDHNETIALLAAAMVHRDVPIIALHLTRPNVTTPDREMLGAGSHLDAAKGAYVLKAFDDSRGPRAGTVIFRGTSPIKAAFELLEKERAALPNVKFVAAPSRALFDRQSPSYRDSVLPWAEWQSSMCVTNNARRSMHDWLANKVCEEYTLSPDFDDRWRTGGSVDEILDESHLTAPWVLKGIQRFAADTESRLARIRG